MQGHKKSKLTKLYFTRAKSDIIKQLGCHNYIFRGPWSAYGKEKTSGSKKLSQQTTTN